MWFTTSTILGMEGNQKGAAPAKYIGGSRDPCYKMAQADVEIPSRLRVVVPFQGCTSAGFTSAGGRPPCR
jgi:hypothetical protein